MNLILCNAQNTNIINNNIASRQQNKDNLMKNKQEAMNHSDGGGGDMDELSDDPSSPETDNFDDSDLLSCTVHDEVTAQLAAAGEFFFISCKFSFILLFSLIGPVGIAAAAAIATAKKRKRPHSFETNPSIRKRQQTRLLRYFLF